MGPLAIVREEVTLTSADREIEATLFYPEQGEAYPLLVFSHGNWSTRDSYDRLLRHWASHGYAIIAPDHLDCCSPVKGIYQSLRLGQYGLVAARTSDLHFVLDNLDSVERAAPGFAGKADRARIAATGHSFGAFSAQQLAGASALDPESGRQVSARREGIHTVVALSPPGPMFDTITAESWQGLDQPTLVTTGTWDIQPGFFDDWRLHLMSHETAVPGEQWALVLQGADHYFGSIICRPERDEAPQEEAFALLLATTTSFLDHRMKGKALPKQLFEAGQLEALTGGFAELRQR